MHTPFDKLNRLRKLAGKNTLKSWKASQEALDAQINRLENEGFEDPGVDPISDEPLLDFGPDAKADIPPTGAEIDAISRLMANPEPAPDPDKLHKHPAKLARGVDGAFTEHCRAAVYSARQKTKKERKLDKERTRYLAGKKPKKAKIKKNKDGTSIKTTTAGNKRKLSKELTEKITKQSKAKSSPSDPDNFTVAELARECEIDPKVARAKLRRHEDKIKKLHSKGQDRWIFPNAARKALKDILTGSKN